MKFKILVIKLLLAILSEVSGLRAGSMGIRHNDLREEAGQAIAEWVKEGE